LELAEIIVKYKKMSSKYEVPAAVQLRQAKSKEYRSLPESSKSQDLTGADLSVNINS